MPIQSEVDRLLAQGVASAQAGQREKAYGLLMDVVELDQHNELGWLWLSTVTDDPDDQRVCLENALTINPNNTIVRQRLSALAANGARPDGTPSPTISAKTVSRPTALVTLWPVVAFWLSVSLFFIGGGVTSLYQFAGILLRARGVIQNLRPIQLAWLPMGLFFVVFGFTGISLAWQLARRRPGGYYGSLLLGLVLTLLGPITTLILEPPNYVATVFTGLMPAVAVLFTLISMTGFQSHVNYQ